MTPEEQKELNELRAFKAKVEPVLHRIYDVLYWDSDEEHYDDEKEWDSACGFIEMVAEQVVGLYGEPEFGSKDYPPMKGKK